MQTRAHIFISGRVQGVSFRYSTSWRARKLGVFGWICNLPDGRVEAIFEGEKEKVEKLLERAKKGSFLARVDNFEIQWEDYKGEFEDFKIKY